MIIREHETEDTLSRAYYSPCETYRYGLSRKWATNDRAVLFVMLNPSTADEMRNDPTIERCERRARAMGFGAMHIANLFGFRATDPSDLRRATQPIGPENDALLNQWHKSANMTLAAWGVHGAHLNRNEEVLGFLTGPLHHLGLTKYGHPRHPLYVAYAHQPEPWIR